MKKMIQGICFKVISLAAIAVLIACGKDSPTGPGTSDDGNKALSGGETTLFIANSQAFRMPAPNVSDLDKHLSGDAAFEAEFVSVPAPVNQGLGPLFNNNACIACHPGDGRGRPQMPGGKAESMFLRISVPGVNPQTGGPLPVPGFGTQLFDKAVFGVQPEATFDVSYAEEPGQFSDGMPYSLRRPTYRIIDPYMPLPPDVMMSPRVAPPVFGRGLLEALSEATILSLADEGDSDGDRISGKPNYVWDPVSQTTVLGRFGLKANNPSLLMQSAGAYNGDIGITTSILPVESSHGQAQYDSTADDPELADDILEAVTFYTQTLAVPARRDLDDPKATRGEQLFSEAKCTGCHTPVLRTGDLPGVPSVSNQTIRPYTDMLLHDMGEGLADHRPDFLADGFEWRTPPLWGIGLTLVVNGHTNFLHDGRARNLTEAILWHGGEAEESREFFRTLPQADREAMLAFLNSL